MAWRLECKTHFGIIWSNFITTVFNCRCICCCDGKVVIRLVYFNNGFFHPRYCRQLPTSLEELLEYQWEQGAQFLMQQASQYDGTMWILHSSVTRIDSESVVAHEHQENIPHVAIVYFFPPFVCFTMHRCYEEKSGFDHSLLMQGSTVLNTMCSPWYLRNGTKLSLTVRPGSN